MHLHWHNTVQRAAASKQLHNAMLASDSGLNAQGHLHPHRKNRELTRSLEGTIQLEEQQLAQGGDQLAGGYKHIHHISILVDLHPLT